MGKPKTNEKPADGSPLTATAGSAPFLPADVARCDGVGDDTEGWREGCETCLRRTAKRGSRVVMMSTPTIIAFECEYLIEPNVEVRHAGEVTEQNQGR